MSEDLQYNNIIISNFFKHYIQQLNNI